MIYSIIGWFYNIRRTDWSQYKQYLNEAVQLSSKSKSVLVIDSFFSSLINEHSPSEYFVYNFFSKSSKERKEWVGTTSMWKAQRKFVPKPLIVHFSNKERFRETFKDLIGYSEFTYSGGTDEQLLARWLNNQLRGADVFIKPTTGQCGHGARRIKATNSAKVSEIIKEKFNDGKYTIQPYLNNHEVLQGFAPSSLNTIRVATKVDMNGKPHVLFARVRLGLKGDVDNLAAGGLAAVVDVKTGYIITDAVVTNTILSPNYIKHPVTNKTFKGVKLPYWDEVLSLALKAARVVPAARVIGWDIAITPEGPVLIEGNHNWCKTLWQLPAGKGMKQELIRLVSEVQT